MLEELIYEPVGHRAKLLEKGSVRVDRAKKMSYLLLTRIETEKCKAYSTLLNCRIICHDILWLPFAYIYKHLYKLHLVYLGGG